MSIVFAPSLTTYVFGLISLATWNDNICDNDNDNDNENDNDNDNNNVCVWLDLLGNLE